MDIAAILLNDTEPFEQLAISFWQKAPCEIWWKLLEQFQRRRHLKIIRLIGLGFNDTSALVAHYVFSPREREKRDRRDSRGDEREG